jgi:hypothetical protein
VLDAAAAGSQTILFTTSRELAQSAERRGARVIALDDPVGDLASA